MAPDAERVAVCISSNPESRDLIARVADYVELPSAGTCCGGAGTYALLRPKDAAAGVPSPKHVRAAAPTCSAK